MGISIRNHCIPAYNELSNMRKIAPIPPELEAMEQETAGGIVRKLRAVVNSDYFKKLPPVATIQAGATTNFKWRKEKSRKEAQQICDECAGELGL